jgi:SAM-dependent MidA family methyltransferase
MLEMGVTARGEKFAWAPQPSGNAPAAVEASCPPIEGYRTEFQFTARGFMRSLGAAFARGVALFVDYGFPRGEYYHPQRSAGTLMCHYRHRAHDDPFFLPGLQDITVHVDFSAIADAGREGGLELLGYASQSQFLVSCGITDLLGETPAGDVATYAPLAAQTQKLLSPAEMGEFFKVIALGKGVTGPLRGFELGDRSRALRAAIGS